MNSPSETVKSYLGRTSRMDHSNPNTELLIEAVREGRVRSFQKGDSVNFIGQALEFGRFLTPRLGFFMLAADGKIVGLNHSNEAYWRLNNSGIEILNRDGGLSTKFNIYVEGATSNWLLGEFHDLTTLHYLTLPRHSDFSMLPP